jgi:hypothetical protein
VNCSGANQQVYISGTDAKSVCSDALCTDFTWTLADVPPAAGPCPTTNVYGLRQEGGFTDFSILKTNALLGQGGPGFRHILWLVFYAPCRGSSGSGVPFTFTVNLTAVVA